MIKVNMLFSFLVAKISKRNKKHVLYVSVELEKRNTRESLTELEKAVETLTCRLLFPQHFSLSQTSTRVSIARWKHGTFKRTISKKNVTIQGVDH